MEWNANGYALKHTHTQIHTQTHQECESLVHTF